MNKSIQFFILSSLLFSLCLTQEETTTTSPLEGKMDYKDDGCSPVEDEDALTVEEEICHGRTAKLSDGSCCVLTFDNSEEYSGRSFCVAMINTSENKKEVTSILKKTQKLTANFNCPVNKYEVSFTDESCANKPGIVNTRKDCKARTANIDGNACCVLEEEGSDTFKCVSVENTKESIDSYIALAEKATSSKFTLDCAGSFIKNSFVIISLLLFFL